MDALLCSIRRQANKLYAIAPLLLSLSAIPQASAERIAIRELAVSIPIADATGKIWEMKGRVCQPVGVEHPRLVVINHGSPPKASDRPGMTPERCDSEAAVWFAERHFATVFVTRLGYGESGGPWLEGYATCSADNYAKAGLETAREIDAIVRGVQSLPGFDPHNVVVVGHSAGGWGTMAYASTPHTDVSALINMAGGRGGHHLGRPNSNCEPENLVKAAAIFGATSRTPMLWVYARNDSFFNSTLANEMADAFRQTGGLLTFVPVGAFGQDGHHLFFGRGGSGVWGPIIDDYLKRASETAPASSTPKP